MKLPMPQLLRPLVVGCALCLGLFGTASAAEPELKIGYVNGERVLREAAPAKAAQSKLEAEFKKRENDLNDVGNRLRLAMEKLEKEGPALSEGERNRRQRELSEQERDFQRKRRELLEDLNQRKNEELAAVSERASKVIKQIFDSEKYDLILTEAAFFSKRVDITNRVIDALNSGK